MIVAERESCKFLLVVLLGASFFRSTSEKTKHKSIAARYVPLIRSSCPSARPYTSGKYSSLTVVGMT
jgi:hypothetical protein